VEPDEDGDYFDFNVYRSRTLPVDTATDPVRCRTSFSRLADGRVATPEGSPVTLTATAADSDTAVDLSWNSVTGALGYHVYLLNPDTKAYEKLAAVPITGVSYTDTTAATGTTHFYRVTAIHADGSESAPGDDWVILSPAT
jgi:fibronectin type 3 domain-containing protein